MDAKIYREMNFILIFRRAEKCSTDLKPMIICYCLFCEKIQYTPYPYLTKQLRQYK